MAQALGSGLGSRSGDSAFPPEESLQPRLHCLRSSPCTSLTLPLDLALLTPLPTGTELKMTRGCIL